MVTTRVYTAEDLWQLPSGAPYELRRGELAEVPPAGGEASAIAGWICSLLIAFVKPRDLGMVTTADGGYLLARDPDTVSAPDVGFVHWERLPARSRPKGHVPVPPDLAIEVKSPSDRRGEVDDKLRAYQDAGVPLVWWVDPDRRAVRVHRLGQPSVVVYEGDVLDGENVLPGFRLPVADIFA
jgi:Uma2 family endonuclease